MSAILALDASSEACSCALNIDGHIVETFKIIPRQHAQQLLPMIDALLKQESVSLAQLDAIAVGQGPGSFTGLRIAIGVAQGLAFGAELPVVCVSDLAALAWQRLESIDIDKNDYVFCCIDARINEVYWGIYQIVSGEPILIGKERLSKPEDIPIAAFGKSPQLIGVGNGLAFIDQMPIEVQNKVSSIEESILPHAADISALASLYFKRGQFQRAEDIKPVYLRDKVTHNKRK